MDVSDGYVNSFSPGEKEEAEEDDFGVGTNVRGGRSTILNTGEM